MPALSIGQHCGKCCGQLLCIGMMVTSWRDICVVSVFNKRSRVVAELWLSIHWSEPKQTEGPSNVWMPWRTLRQYLCHSIRHNVGQFVEPALDKQSLYADVTESCSTEITFFFVGLSVRVGSPEDADVLDAGREEFPVPNLRADDQLLQSLRVHEHGVLVRGAVREAHLWSERGRLQHTHPQVHLPLQHELQGGREN